MQERRTTIRIPHRCRTQYCPSADFLPRDGRITTLSERGAGLLAREAHQAGGQVTVSFSLPEDGDLWTATGLIRWSEPRSANGPWCPLGLEWLPLEETTRHRLHQFLYSRAVPAAGRSTAKGPRRLRAWLSVRRLAIVAGVIVVVLAGVLGTLWALSLESENRRFEQIIVQRNAALQHLTAREVAIQHDLAAARTYITTTSGTVNRLDAQASLFQEQVQQLSQDLARFQASYGQVLQEREGLIAQALRVQQGQVLEEVLPNVAGELRLVIREAIASRHTDQTDSPGSR